MIFNINDEVRVKLTSFGHELMRKNWDAVFKGDAAFPYKRPEEDAEGYSCHQLWRLMQEFGEHIGNGKPLLFSTNIEIPEPREPAYRLVEALTPLWSGR